MGEIASLLPLLQGATSVAGAASQYGASMAEGRYARNVGNMNAQLALQQAEDADRVGMLEASRRLEQGSRDASTARAKYAAQGINVDTGAAAQTQEDVRLAAAKDAATIRRNAAMQAWGFGMDAINSRTRGSMAYTAGRYQGAQSLISGGLQFARYAGEAAGRYRPTADGGFDYAAQEEHKKVRQSWDKLD